jgi:phage FluMu protein Com
MFSIPVEAFIEIADYWSGACPKCNGIVSTNVFEGTWVGATENGGCCRGAVLEKQCPNCHAILEAYAESDRNCHSVTWNVKEDQRPLGNTL